MLNSIIYLLYATLQNELIFQTRINSAKVLGVVQYTLPGHKTNEMFTLKW